MKVLNTIMPALLALACLSGQVEARGGHSSGGHSSFGGHTSIRFGHSYGGYGYSGCDTRDIHGRCHYSTAHVVVSWIIWVAIFACCCCGQHHGRKYYNNQNQEEIIVVEG